MLFGDGWLAKEMLKCVETSLAVEMVSDFIFLGSKITADGDCSHEIKNAYSLEEKL